MSKFFLYLGMLLWVGSVSGEVTAPPYLPEKQSFQRVDTIKVNDIPGGPTQQKRAAKESRSLNGNWKISPLLTSPAPFTETNSEEKSFIANDFDDSHWDSIKVPLNWYRQYRKAQDASNPYVKGWYRTAFELTPDDLHDRRVILKFDVVGSDATVYLNGKRLGRHLGEFTGFELDGTEAAKPGRNVLAVRVLSDQGMRGGIKKVNRVYGSQWSLSNIKGGIWQNVTLSLEPTLRIRDLLVTPRLETGSIEVDYTIVNTTGKHVRAVLEAQVSPAMRLDRNKKINLSLPVEVELKPGVNQGSFPVRLKEPVKWSVTAPYLYYLTLNVKENQQTISCDAVRFGYRDFKIRNGKFYLNGEEIYLFGQNISSIHFGGYGLDPKEEERKITEQLKLYRDLGYVITRTAHMPILPAVLDVADELGIMIFHEWGWSFTAGLDFPEFEKNNLREVADFVRSSYNHPSVTMWSMGNEVVHRNNPDIARQMDLQVGLVRKLDKSGRPISTFSGAAGWTSYGETKLDTDLHDLHTYTALSAAWTRLPEQFDSQYAGELRIYEEKDKLSRPLVAWENVGFSWGTFVDKKFKRGNAKQYAAYMARPTNWGQPNGVGFVGCAPLFKAVGPGFSEWAQTLYGRRVFELYRLNLNYTGFAPWFGGIAASTLWTQPVLPSLHSDQKLFPRNLFLGESTPWNAAIVNSTNHQLHNLTLEYSLLPNQGEEIAAGSTRIAEVPAQGKFTGKTELTIPATVKPGNCQLRLTLKDAAGREIGRNYYDLYLQSRSILTRKIEQCRPIFVLDTKAPENLAVLEKLLNNFGLHYTVIATPAKATTGSLLIVPPELAETQQLQLHDHAAINDFLRNRDGILLVLEQKNPLSIFPGNQRLSGDGNTFVDLVIPDHPLFADLDHTSFDTWNTPDHGFIVSRSFVPYTVNALAVKGAFLNRKNIGGAVIEASYGNGRILLSQLEATANARHDSVAATYLYNLFHYAAGMKKLNSWALPLSDAAGNVYTPVKERLEMIDLSSKANTSFTDDVPNDNKGGWTDQGNNDFRMMPLGKIDAGGVIFNVIDPAKNNGKSCLVVRGTERPQLPLEVKGIPVGKKYSRLFFMHTAAWGNRGNAGVYRIHYADGKHVDVPLIAGRNIGDWWTVAPLPDAKIGLTTRNATGNEVGTYVTAWENPRPDASIAAIDFLSETAAQGSNIDWLPVGTPVPVLIAITGERSGDAPVNLTSDKVFKRANASKDTHSTIKGEVTVRKENGFKVLQITFPASQGKDCPAVMLTFDKQAVKAEFQYLTFYAKSESGGTIQFTLPEKEWKGTYTGDAAIRGDGQWHKYRLKVGSEFKPNRNAAYSTLRGELFLFYRNSRAPEANRPGMDLEIRDISLE